MIIDSSSLDKFKFGLLGRKMFFLIIIAQQ